MSYQQEEQRQDVILKMAMQLEYMTASLDIVQMIMERIYGKPDDSENK